MQVIKEIPYYKVNEAAKQAGVNTRTLRRWIAAGCLDHFLFPYRQTPTGPMYYRLVPPDPTDRKWEGEDVYVMPTEDDGAKRRRGRPKKVKPAEGKGDTHGRGTDPDEAE